MTKLILSKSIRKFIRLEKSRIRATVLDIKKQEEAIKNLYDGFIKNMVSPGNVVGKQAGINLSDLNSKISKDKSIDDGQGQNKEIRNPKARTVKKQKIKSRSKK